MDRMGRVFASGSSGTQSAYYVVYVASSYIGTGSDQRAESKRYVAGIDRFGSGSVFTITTQSSYELIGFAPARFSGSTTSQQHPYIVLGFAFVALNIPSYVAVRFDPSRDQSSVGVPGFQPSWHRKFYIFTSATQIREPKQWWSAVSVRFAIAS